MDSYKITNTEYIVMFLMLAFSGNPLFVTTSSFFSVIFLFILLLFYLGKDKPILKSRYFLVWVLGSCALFAIQKLCLKEVSIPADVNFLLRLLSAFLVYNYLREKFRKAYFNVIYFLCIISLFCYVFYLLFRNLPMGFIVSRYQSWILYNQIVIGAESIPRNSGMFWEPGAFQGYIMLAFMLYYSHLDELWKTKKRQMIVILIAIATTMSTTGFVTLFVLFISKFWTSVRSWVRPVLLISLVVFSYWAYHSFDFLSEKIAKDIHSAEMVQEGKMEVSWSRSGAMFIDFQNIARHPIVGNGFLMESRYENLGGKMNGAGNGFSGAINMFGLVFIFFYLFCIYKNKYGNSKIENLTVVLVVVLLLNGEYFLNYSAFWVLIFINSSHFFKRKKHERTLVIYE